MKKLLFGLIILVMFASCAGSRTGYGCKGKESWKGMIKRINKPY